MSNATLADVNDIYIFLKKIKQIFMSLNKVQTQILFLAILIVDF